jgi:FkbM family methyltransferase
MTLPEFVYTVLLRPPLLRRVANAAIKAVLPKTIRVGDALIWINPNDPVISGALTFRVYERDEVSFFRSHFGRNMTLIDVGANVGLYTGIAMSTIGFQGKILAIEPHGESRSFLLKTIQSNRGAEQHSNVMVCDCAVSDHSGALKFYKNSQNRGDNRLYPDPLLDQEEIVVADTLDNICQRYGIESVDFLKVDVQGAEAKVIDGASKVLKRSGDCILMTEFWPYGLARSGSDPLGYLDSLTRLGFTLHELPRKGKRVVPIANLQALISRAQGRNYVNLLGLKGKVATMDLR